MITCCPLLASCKLGVVLLLLQMIVASTCRQGVVESPASFTLCPSAGPAVILLVVQGSFSEVHWTCLGCLQQGRLPRVGSQCFLDCLWQSDLWAPQMRKMDWECSLAIWQSPSGAKQSLGWKMLLQWESCRVFFLGEGKGEGGISRYFCQTLYHLDLQGTAWEELVEMIYEWNCPN